MKQIGNFIISSNNSRFLLFVIDPYGLSVSRAFSRTYQMLLLLILALVGYILIFDWRYLRLKLQGKEDSFLRKFHFFIFFYLHIRYNQILIHFLIFYSKFPLKDLIILIEKNFHLIFW